MIDLNQIVKISWNSYTKEHYMSLGYKYTKNGDTFDVCVKDLLPSSGIKVKAICDYCGEYYFPIYKNYNNNKKRGKKDCCKKCSHKKSNETMLAKYGVDWFTQSEDFVKKVKSTCLKKYGVENPSQIEWVKEKKIKTNKEKFGADWFVETQEFVSFCEENYGVNNPMKSREIMDKAANSLYKNGNTPVSKNEQKMFDIIKEIYGKDRCYQSYPCHKFSMDCMLDLDDVKIDIEYDGWYWHKTRQKYDRCRDAALKKYGYKILRIKANDEIPSKEQIIDAVNSLKTSELKQVEINLDI